VIGSKQALQTVDISSSDASHLGRAMPFQLASVFIQSKEKVTPLVKCRAHGDKTHEQP
jgi:hypothetical protein